MKKIVSKDKNAPAQAHLEKGHNCRTVNDSLPKLELCLQVFILSIVYEQEHRY